LQFVKLDSELGLARPQHFSHIMCKVGILTLVLGTVTGFHLTNPDSCIINYSDYCKEIGQGCLDPSFKDLFFSNHKRLHLWTVYSTSDEQIRRNFSGERCSINDFGRPNFCYPEYLALITYGQYSSNPNSMTVAKINSGIRDCKHDDLTSTIQIVSPYFVFNLYPSLRKIKVVYGICPSCEYTRIFFQDKIWLVRIYTDEMLHTQFPVPYGASYFTMEKLQYRQDPGGRVYDVRCPYQRNFPSRRKSYIRCQSKRLLLETLSDLVNSTNSFVTRTQYVIIKQISEPREIGRASVIPQRNLELLDSHDLVSLAVSSAIVCLFSRRYQRVGPNYEKPLRPLYFGAKATWVFS